MDADFSITVHPVHQLVEVTLSGFFTAADVARFADARAAAHARLRPGRNQHLTLVDVRSMKIQSRDIVDAFGAVLADPGFHARRLAFVVEKTLARSQSQRAAAGRDARFFTAREAALRWLVTGEPVPAPGPDTSPAG